MPLIAVHDLAFSYTNSMADAIFRDVAFSVGAGDVLCLLGPNGTGKSTLLKCLGNVLQGWRGVILLDGSDISAMRPSDVAKGIGYVPQNQAPGFPRPLGYPPTTTVAPPQERSPALHPARRP